MTTSTFTTLALLASVAVVAPACSASAPEETQVSEGKMEMYDACSGAVIGERDVESGDLLFYATGVVVPREEIEELTEPRELPACPDPTEVQPATYMPVECFQMGPYCGGCGMPPKKPWVYCSGF